MTVDPGQAKVNNYVDEHEPDTQRNKVLDKAKQDKMKIEESINKFDTINAHEIDQSNLGSQVQDVVEKNLYTRFQTTELKAKLDQKLIEMNTREDNVVDSKQPVSPTSPMKEDTILIED